jgi:hypothetical protein
MRFRIGSALLGLALAVSMTALALAQADDDPATPDNTTTADTAMTAPVPDAQAVAPTLFLRVVDPTEDDVQVSLDTADLTVRGSTLPGTVVSINGELADIDELGNFVGVSPLEEGANEIEVLASDAQGNSVSRALFVARGD